MEFPETFDEFADSYGFVDTKEVYTNGSHLIPVFRVKQWLEHISEKTQMIDKSNFDTEQYKTDLQSAYDCGYNKALSENKGEWIPVSERLPEKEKERYLIDYEHEGEEYITVSYYDKYGFWSSSEVKAWQPLPEPYKGESEDK